MDTHYSKASNKATDINDLSDLFIGRKSPQRRQRAKSAGFSRENGKHCGNENCLRYKSFTAGTDINKLARRRFVFPPSPFRETLKRVPRQCYQAVNNGYQQLHVDIKDDFGVPVTQLLPSYYYAEPKAEAKSKKRSGKTLKPSSARKGSAKHESRRSMSALGFAALDNKVEIYDETSSITKLALSETPTKNHYNDYKLPSVGTYKQYYQALYDKYKLDAPAEFMPERPEVPDSEDKTEALMKGVSSNALLPGRISSATSRIQY